MTYSSHMIYIDCDRHLTWFDIWFLYWLTLLLSVHISYVISVLFQYCLSLCTLFICTNTFLFLTHSCTLRYWMFYVIDQVFDWDRTCCEELEFFSIHSSIIVFLFVPIDYAVFLILYTLLSVIIPLFLFICYNVWAFICSIAVILIDFL